MLFENMDTAPRFQSVDRFVTTAIAIEQSLALLLENGPGFSLLLAARASTDPRNGSLRLEDCSQARIETDGRTSLKKFPEVAIEREPKHLFWVASPDQFTSVFSQPSEDPYLLLELAKSQSLLLNRAIRQRDFDLIFATARELYSRLPGFYSSRETELVSPENYAAGRKYFPGIKRFL